MSHCTKLPLFFWVSVAMVLSLVAAAPTRRQCKASKAEPVKPMPLGDVRLAYQLMNVLNPFPVEEVSGACPLSWRVAAALG